MSSLENVNALVVHQKKEWTEIFTDFETRNRYEVVDGSGNVMFEAAEVGGSFLARHFLRANRGFQIHVRTPGGQPFIRVARPFRFYFHEAVVFDSTDQQIGSMKREFSVTQKRYVLYDRHGRESLTLTAKLFHPWTFEITENEVSRGKITKRWSGLGKEMFTDADNFAVVFDGPLTSEQRSVLLGAVFLIDFAHFEEKGGNN
ncbi:MAG: phospholipid scramblase-related protein [Spirochaetales bacterium]